MFSPNNPHWNRADWGMLAIFVLASLLLLLWCVLAAYARVAPPWLTLPLCAGFLGWAWLPLIRWWRGG